MFNCISTYIKSWNLRLSVIILKSWGDSVLVRVVLRISNTKGDQNSDQEYF